MPNSTAIIDAFLAQGALLLRERPFGPLPPPDEPLDQLPIPTLIYLRWLASRDAFIDHSVGSTIAGSDSPLELVAHLRARFHEAIPGGALGEDALNFTVEYFSPHATYLSDFFSVFPENTRLSQDEMWSGQEKMWKLLDLRHTTWRNGDSPRRAPRSDDEEESQDAETLSSGPMDASVWISTLHDLSNAVGDQRSCWAYSDHFYTPLTAIPSDEVVLAVMREFLRNPPHDASIMCSAENFLSDIPFLRYISAYSILAPDLLDLSPDAALSLFNYPGCELTPLQVRQFIQELRRRNPERDVVGELAKRAIAWNADEDEPFASVVEAAHEERQG